LHTVGTNDASRVVGPEEAADRTFAAHERDGAWLDAFTERLDRRRRGASFAHTMEVWGLSQAEVARLFGVSRQAVGKWLRRGAPPERAGAIADLSAASDLLVHHLKRDRIPAVVRRPIPALGGESLVALWGRGETRAVLAACRDMFRFDRAHA
jgi:DNA-binding transcriptional regulator YdaS (Cro superfamily)